MATIGTVGATAWASSAGSYFCRSPDGMSSDLISLIEVAAAGSRNTFSLSAWRALAYHMGKYWKVDEVTRDLVSRSLTVWLPAIQRRRLAAACSGETVQARPVEDDLALVEEDRRAAIGAGEEDLALVGV